MYGNDFINSSNFGIASCIFILLVEYISRVVGPAISFCTTLLIKLYSERTLKPAAAKSDLYFDTESVGTKMPPATKKCNRNHAQG